MNGLEKSQQTSECLWPGSELSTSVTAIAKSYSLWMQNAKFKKSSKNHAKRPEHERLHIISVPTCSKIPTTSLHLLLCLTYSLFATPLCFPQCCPSHPFFKYFRMFCSHFRTRRRAYRMKHATSSSCIISLSAGCCWRVALTLRANASSICNSSRQNSSGVLCSSGLLRNVCRELCIDVSGRYIRPIFNGPLGLLTQLPTRAA